MTDHKFVCSTCDQPLTATREMNALVLLGNILQALDGAGAAEPSTADKEPMAPYEKQLGSVVHACARIRALGHRVADLCWEIGELRAVSRDLVDTIGRARRSRTQKGGQQVAYHDDFAHVTPSVANALDYWAKRLDLALAAKSPTIQTCIYCGGQILAHAFHEKTALGPSHYSCPRTTCLHCHRPIVRGEEVHEAPAGYAHRECSRAPLTPEQVAQNRVRIDAVLAPSDAAVAGLKDELGALARETFDPMEVRANGEWTEFAHHHPDEAETWRRVGIALYRRGYRDGNARGATRPCASLGCRNTAPRPYRFCATCDAGRQDRNDGDLGGQSAPCVACDGRGTTAAQPGGQGDWTAEFCSRCGGSGEAS